MGDASPGEHNASVVFRPRPAGLRFSDLWFEFATVYSRPPCASSGSEK